jgi:hypothetical protein
MMVHAMARCTVRKAYQSKGLANHRWTKIHWQVNNPGHQR